ncbi:MAG: mechanosensitive ion channel [Francisellaceae bacterium]|jgi:small conductance mechanosensitive channel|nr:mechanosensitive ion channel [Francisellaceae bacterium]MBT6207507.1 mechanosensitive ion channel [Francisellaceae bacterium]MBT6538451.1 mechanosensitive ion channel [Francisellaceae bacterium]
MNVPWAARLHELTAILDFKSIIDFLLVLCFGIIVALIVSSFISKTIARKASPHYTILIRRLLYYGLLLVTLVVALPISPLNLAALGAVLTFAVGFATRAPLSNIINGLVLVFEKPFVIGDEISVNETIGTVISIDLLSVRILSKDNRLIRLPNELIFNSKLNNLSKYKIRRLDTEIYIDTEQNIKEIENVFLSYAKNNKEILENPSPDIIICEFRESSIKIKFLTWLPNGPFETLKGKITKDILSLIQQNNIKLAKTLVFQSQPKTSSI